MTREIMDMAREVDVVTQVLLDRKATQKMEHDVFVLFLERFAKLVREDEREARSMRWDELIAKAVEAEREACAKVCESTAPSQINGYECADAIRARGQA